MHIYVESSVQYCLRHPKGRISGGRTLQKRAVALATCTATTSMRQLHRLSLFYFVLRVRRRHQ